MKISRLMISDYKGEEKDERGELDARRASDASEHHQNNFRTSYVSSSKFHVYQSHEKPPLPEKQKTPVYLLNLFVCWESQGPQ